MIDRSGALHCLLRAVAAAASLLALLVGLPWLLVATVGNPLGSLPSFDAVARAVETGDIGSDVLVRAIAALAWVVWLQFAVAFVGEVVATARRRPAPRLRVLGAAESVVARLVATVLLAWSTVGVRPAAAAPLDAAIGVAGRAGVVAPALPAPSAAPAVAAPVSDEPAAVTVTYEVKPRDCLWTIAERELGDPLRWREIAALNEGREQPDGSVLRSADLIRPGWVLTLPAHTPGPAAGPTPAASSERVASTGAAPNVEVHRGDSLWAIAERELGDGARWGELYEINHDVPQADGRALVDPSVIEVGWQLRLPGVAVPSVAAATDSPDVGAPAPAPPGEAPAPTAPTVTSSEPAQVSAPEPAPPVEPSGVSAVPGDRREDPAPSRRVVVGGIVAAAAAVAALDRARRRVARRRRPGRRPAPVDERTAAHELRARAAASPEVLDRLRDAMGALADAPPARARPLAWFLAADAVEVQFDEVDRAPTAGFAQGASGTRWRRTRFEAREASGVAPACMGVGVDGASELVLDVEAAGSVAVDGPVEVVAEFLATSAAVLGESVTGGADVVVVDDTGGPEATAVEHALALARAHASSCAAALDASGVATTFAARVRGEGDWAPLVVLAREPLDEAAAAELVNLAGDGGRGIAIVAPALGDAAWRIAVAADGAVAVPRLAWSGRLAPAEVTDAATACLAAATGLDTSPVEDDDGDGSPVLSVLPVDPTPFTEPAFDVEVRVLGDVVVDGGATPLDPRSTELVAFLACHPDGAREERVKTALWPDALPAASSWTNRVSKVRKALGVGRGGELHLPHIAPGGRYSLGEYVTSDLARVRARLAAAPGQEPSRAIATLDEALDLVRGTPFGSVRGYDWAFALGFVAEAEAVVVDTGHELARRCIEAGDASGALRAVERASRAAPGNEILARDRMLAHDLAGDPGGVDAAMRDLCAVLETDDPDADLHPDTLDLYERLRRRRRPTA